MPPPKKSCPASDLSDLSLSSNGGNPQVITFTTESKFNIKINSNDAQGTLESRHVILKTRLLAEYKSSMSLSNDKFYSKL